MSFRHGAMRYAFSMSLHRSPFTLDHVGFAAPALESLCCAFESLGFAVTAPRGLHHAGATSGADAIAQRSSHAVFERGYLEFTAVSSGAPTHHLAAWVAEDPRPVIVAFGCADAVHAREMVAARGIALGAVAEAERKVEYGAHAGLARFRWSALPAAATPESLLCLVEHRDAMRIFQPEVQRHANGAVRLLGLEWQVPNAQFAVTRARYGALLGASPVSRSVDGAACFELSGGTRVILRANACARYVATVVIGVIDLVHARACLRLAGVAYAEVDEGIEIAAPLAGGAALRLAVMYPRGSRISRE